MSEATLVTLDKKRQYLISRVRADLVAVAVRLTPATLEQVLDAYDKRVAKDA